MAGDRKFSRLSVFRPPPPLVSCDGGHRPGPWSLLPRILPALALPHLLPLPSFGGRPSPARRPVLMAYQTLQRDHRKHWPTQRSAVTPIRWAPSSRPAARDDGAPPRPAWFRGEPFTAGPPCSAGYEASHLTRSEAPPSAQATSRSPHRTRGLSAPQIAPCAAISALPPIPCPEPRRTASLMTPAAAPPRARFRCRTLRR